MRISAWSLPYRRWAKNLDARGIRLRQSRWRVYTGQAGEAKGISTLFFAFCKLLLFRPGYEGIACQEKAEGMAGGFRDTDAGRDLNFVPAETVVCELKARVR